MITAAGIPRIDGDMGALAGHAQGISEFGTAFADTGARLNATWQGLAAVYQAPEAGQLLAAMAPVRAVCASVGEDHQTAGRVLGSYAAEVREIQARLDALRAQAGAFETSVAGDTDWADDPAKAQHNDELLRAVNQAVADFEAAEIRCANAISALYGGQQYHISDGDGRHEPGEYGHTAAQLNTAAEQGALPWGTPTTADGGILADLGRGIMSGVLLLPGFGFGAAAALSGYASLNHVKYVHPYPVPGAPGVMQGSKEVPDEAMRKVWKGRAKIFRWGGGLTAGAFAAVEQVERDAKNPNYSTAERTGRAVAQGATVGGGAAVGGMAAGAAIGSVVPGAGTAVGAVVGFAAGAVGGYFAAEGMDEINDGAVDWAGDAADYVADTGGDALDEIGSWF